MELNKIYKEQASELARQAHAYYCQRMPGFKPEDFNANLAKSIYDVLVETAGGTITMGKIPQTDAQAEQVIRQMGQGLYYDNLLALYQVQRAKGESVARSWGEALSAGASIPVADFIKEL